MAVVAFAVFRPDPYSFLYRFHPRIVNVDLAKLQAQLPTGSPPPTSVVQMKMFIFRTEDSAAVLQAMKAELTSQRGFSPYDLTAARPAKGAAPEEVTWDFERVNLSPAEPVPGRHEALLYSAGTSAWYEMERYEKGPSAAASAPLGLVRTACIVMALHEESWLDRTLDTVRGFFHIH